ncbi:VOC family protein [bacterium]|nr:VOC family protein [bacterium]
MDASAMPQAPAGSGEHPLCWLEIAARDLEASKAFYGQLFGWNFDEIMPGYAIFQSPAGLPGGLSSMPPAIVEGSQQTKPYIYTADIDAALAGLEERGMKIVQPKTPVMEWGHVAMFVDSAGTTYGLSNMSAQIPVPVIPSGLGSGEKPPAGSVCSIELYGGNFDEARRLFADYFGWGLLDTMPQYMMFNAGGGISGVFQGHTAVAQSMPYIYVDDVRAKIAQIEAAGGKSLAEPASMPGMGTFGYFTDPSGTAMGLIGP